MDYDHAVNNSYRWSMYNQNSIEEVTMSETDLIDHPDSPESHEKQTPEFAAFQKAFELKPDVDWKLQLAIDFMEQSLAKEGTPHFRNFWDARRLCLPLFRENVSPMLRTVLWNKYSELSKEARRLKEILDEQSAFATEQIEIAIQAVEKDIEQIGQTAKTGNFNIALPPALSHQADFYKGLQSQLNVLNVQATRINGLRKELIKTEMRVRQKNKFFQRLSLIGNTVFPKRKELIKQISDQFSADVDQFIQSNFSNELRGSLFNLRDDIKALQGLAKELTLNTGTFSQTRVRLSECWDKMRGEEKERKKEWSQQKAAFKDNADLVRQKINEAREIFEKDGSVPEGNIKIDEISAFMRKTELGRDEVKSLREELNGLRTLVHDKARTAEETRQQHEAEKNRQKKEKFHSLKDLALNLLRQAETYEPEALTAERDDILKQIQEAAITKIEKQEIEKLLKPIKEIIANKKELELLKLSDDDRQALQQLKEILTQRKSRRQEIKDQLEQLRKGAGSSTLDFEKAMSVNEQINEEKDRLEKASQGIREIEQKISELQKLVNKG